MSPPVKSLEAGYDPEIGDLNRPSPPKPLLGSPEADYDPEIGDLSRPPPEPNGLSQLARAWFGPLWSWMTPKPAIKSYDRRSCQARALCRATGLCEVLCEQKI